MALNPAAVFQQLEMPERPDWQTQVQQGLALKNTGLAVKANKLALQNQEKATRDAAALSEAVIAGAGDWAKTRDALAKKGFGDAAMKIDAHIESQSSEKLLQDVRRLDQAIKQAELDNAPEKYMWQALKDAAEYRLRNEQTLGAERTRLNAEAEGQRKADEFAVTGGATGDLGDFRRLTPAASDVTAPAASPDEPTGQLATAPRAKPQTTGQFFEFMRGKTAATAQPQAIIPGRDVPLSPEVEAQRRRISSSGSTAAQTMPTSNIPESYQAMLSRTLLRSTPNQKRTAMDAANQAWSQGGEPALRGLIAQAAIEGENVDAQTQIEGRMAAIESLDAITSMLAELKASGVDTNILRGNVEDVARNLGTSTDPRLATLGTRIGQAFIEYRRSLTGVQFSVPESEQYEKLFPNYRNTLPVNEAVLKGLKDGMGQRDRQFWRIKVGDETFGEKLRGNSADSGSGSDLKNASTDELLKRLTQ